MTHTIYYTHCPRCGGDSSSHCDTHQAHVGAHSVAHGARHLHNPIHAAVAALGAAVAVFQYARSCLFTCSVCGHRFVKMTR